MNTSSINVSNHVLNSTEQVEVPKKSPELSTDLCTRLFYKMRNHLMHFSIGMAYGSLMLPLMIIAEKAPMIIREMANGRFPRLTYKNGLEDYMSAVEILGVEKFEERLQPNVLQITLRPNATTWISLFAAACFEEILFRGLLQDVLLTRFPKYVVKKIAPSKAAWLDSSDAKQTRTLLVAAVFGAVHLANNSSGPALLSQVVQSFMSAIGYGLLKESTVGLVGAMGAHVAENFIAVALMFSGGSTIKIVEG